MIDHQAYGDRNILVPEEPDGLPHAVFVNLKIPLAETGDIAALAVVHRGLQRHQAHVH